MASSKELKDLPWTDDKIQAWFERFEAMCRRAKVSDELEGEFSPKTDFFISIMGEQAYEKLRNLTAPKKPESMVFEQLKELIINHISPKKRITVAERYKFNMLKQDERETAAEFENRLRAQADKCDFKSFLLQALRDRFVVGLLSKTVVKELLLKEDLDLDTGPIGMNTKSARRAPS
jgi:hypothetical protein